LRPCASELLAARLELPSVEARRVELVTPGLHSLRETSTAETAAMLDRECYTRPGCFRLGGKPHIPQFCSH